MTRRQYILCSLLLLLLATAAWADISTLANRALERLTFTSTGLNVTSGPTTSACKTITVNASGTANAGITVDATAGGITIYALSTTRCGVLIYNLQGGGDILCAPTGVTPTTTVGTYIAAGQSLSLGAEAQQAMKCIRQAAVSATVYVTEATP